MPRSAAPVNDEPTWADFIADLKAVAAASEGDAPFAYLRVPRRCEREALRAVRAYGLDGSVELLGHGEQVPDTAPTATTMDAPLAPADGSIPAVARHAGPRSADTANRHQALSQNV